ncbi:hypothetical protein HRI_005047900 [Hibiscus trionum]|uniref:RING-type domain-containing protein n=1 Tax=Hibiscus trionum TaxID=183268 RepID=A0A9W7JIN0_HIBTR|nr:hypothetical protein HRI_005047900 [Hibiscus trionum]
MEIYKLGNYFSFLSIVRPLKWAWNLLFHYSLFPYHMRAHIVGVEDCNKQASGDDIVLECAICLCKIDDDDEIGDLRCDHLFHKVCLDRWIGYQGSTCPICRTPLIPPLKLVAAMDVVLFNYCSFDDSGHREIWWLR